jgi:hypothetical protein
MMRNGNEEWYGGAHTIPSIKGDKRAYAFLNGVTLSFHSEENKVYGNQYEIKHNFTGHLNVSVKDYNQKNFKILGQQRNIPNAVNIEVPIRRLPAHLQEKLKEVWMEIEMEMGRSLE